MISYTYLIGWTELDRWYYGVQFNKQANPYNLMRSYFTSSKVVHELIEKHGKPDVIEVRRCFKTADEARTHELTVIRRLALRSEKWLNQACGGIFEYTPEIRAKMSASQKGKTHSPEARAKMSAAKMGKVLSEEHKAKLRGRTAWNKGMKGPACPEHLKEQFKALYIGIPRSLEVREKIKDGIRKRKEYLEHKLQTAA